MSVRTWLLWFSFLLLFYVCPIFSAPANDSVTLAWDPSPRADVYYVQRSLTSGGPYTTISPALISTSFVDETVASGTTYYYVVYAENEYGASGPSSEVSATLQPPPPAAPDGLAATAGDGQVSLFWNSTSGADVYYVERSTTSGGSYVTVSPALTSTSYVDQSLVNGMTYYYVVRAESSSGQSPPSVEVSATPESLFVRGDSNADRRVDVTDATTVLSCLFSGQLCPSCYDSADCNDDGAFDITDAVCVLTCLFTSGGCPAPPFPDCGVDETIDTLDCSQYPSCS